MHDHRKLRVWHAARQLALDVYEVTKSFPTAERFGITDQIRRSAVSIPANIAEGAGRDGAAFKQFLGYASGSASELDTHLDIARELGFGDPSAVARALADLDAIRRMLWGLIQRS